MLLKRIKTRVHLLLGNIILITISVPVAHIFGTEFDVLFVSCMNVCIKRIDHGVNAVSTAEC